MLMLVQCDMRQPSCSRCVHLRIPCIGSGRQRFRFVGGTAMMRGERKPFVSIEPICLDTISRQICGETSNLQSALALALQNENVAYDLSMWGTFLSDVPCRLGHNKALDASAKALIGCYDGFRADAISMDAIEDYSEALAVLRISLSNEQEATCMNTICAVYLLVICQVCLTP